jgi:hypothetical protein
VEQHWRQGDPAARGGSLKDTCTYPGEGTSKYYCDGDWPATNWPASKQAMVIGAYAALAELTMS